MQKVTRDKEKVKKLTEKRNNINKRGSSSNKTSKCRRRDEQIGIRISISIKR